MGFLSNPVYLGLIIGALCFLTSVLVPVAIYLKERSKKEVSYAVYGNIPLLNIKEEIKESFEVSYMGIPVQDATLLNIRVWNSGKVPIEEADFIDPIKLDFGKDATVIFFRIGYNTDNILSQYTKSLTGEGYITFKPRLLNKGYWISVVVMVTGFSGHVKAEGLIKGVHSIRNVKYPSNTGASWKRTFFFSLFACEISLVVAAICIAASSGLKFYTQAPGYPSSLFDAISTVLLISVFLSGFTALEIFLSMKGRQFDNTFIKQIFSIVKADLEKKAQNQTPRQAKKTTPPAS